MFSASRHHCQLWSLILHSIPDPTVRRVPYAFPKLDGNVDKDIWQAVPWSEPFGDLRQRWTQRARSSHQFKALYDDTHLYIAARVEPAPRLSTQAHFICNAILPFFIDVGFNDNHGARTWHFNYKELEINAINTVWNLLLDKPYQDDGTEHSGRVAKSGPSQYYDVTDQITATRVVSGQLNDPNHQGRSLWMGILAVDCRVSCLCGLSPKAS